MISNKYKFIFLHSPKTGGTTISTALHEDIGEECEVVFDEEGDISHIYPSPVDFPWWSPWVEHARYIADAHDRIAAAGVEYPLYKVADLVFTRGLISAWNRRAGSKYQTGFMPPLARHVGEGNIKHLTLAHWECIIHDGRIRVYNSFLPEYEIFASCRNPYEREFSWFIYEHAHTLINKIQVRSTGAGEQSTESVIKEEWEKWAKGTLEENPAQPFSMSTPQVQTLQPYDPNNKELNPYATLIKLENLEEDYNKMCEKLSIPRKTKKMPHKVNFRKKWEKHLPSNILEWYTEEIRELIHTHRAADFEILGYRKNVLEHRE